VSYDKEVFNYEEYSQKGLSDKRLIRDFLFMPSIKGSKMLVAEFFKFQQQNWSHVEKDQLELNTTEKITNVFNLLATHLTDLHKVNS